MVASFLLSNNCIPLSNGNARHWVSPYEYIWRNDGNIFYFL